VHVIEQLGDALYLSHAEQRLRQTFDLTQLHQWTARYQRAQRDDAELAAIGQALWQWLDPAFTTALQQASGPRQLEIRSAAVANPLGDALLDLPWELLHGPKDFLAADATQPWVLSRRLGAPQTPKVARFREFKLLFMAAAPEQQQMLDFELEESAILKATQQARLRLGVEESGALEGLGKIKLIFTGVERELFEAYFTIWSQPQFVTTVT
jgi:hypothetical protein